MVAFRNNVGSAPVTNWVSPKSSQIAFGRGLCLTLLAVVLSLTFDKGSLGFVAINNADSAWTTTFTTSLGDGQYCDVIGGGSVSGSCTGTS